MYTGRTKVDFDAAHRLLDYDGKCAVPHGHTYQAELRFAIRDLDNLGISIDFGDVKKPLKRWIDENWDHAFLVNDQDEEMLSSLRQLTECKIYAFEGENPTAEVMARTLFDVMTVEIGNSVISIRMWEGLNSYAEYSPNGDSDSSH